MSVRVHVPATYEDLLKVPANLVAELIDGELFTSPRPRGRHTNAASALGALLMPPFQFGINGPGGWWIQDEPEVHLGGNAVVPDLAGWRRERMPEIPDNHIYAVVPDWVCEILSPSNQRLDRAFKMPLYARYGVPYAWVVDVDRQFLEVKRLVDGRWSNVETFTGAAKVSAEPFEAVEIDMTFVWGPPPA